MGFVNLVWARLGKSIFKMIILLFFDMYVWRGIFWGLFIILSQNFYILYIYRWGLLHKYYEDVYMFVLILLYCYIYFVLNSLSLIFLNDYSLLQIGIVCICIFMSYFNFLWFCFFLKDIMVFYGLFMGGYSMNGLCRICLLLLEVFSLLCRSISLFLRLFCNLFSAHFLLHMYMNLFYFIILFVFYILVFLIFFLFFYFILLLDILSSVLQIII